MQEFRLEIAIDPFPKARHRQHINCQWLLPGIRSGKYHDPKTLAADIRRCIQTYTPKETRQTEDALRAHLRAENAPFFEGPLALEACFFIKRPKTVKRLLPETRPDLDNYVKTLKDACNGVLWRDDAQIVDLHAYKRYGDSGKIQIICRAL